MTELAVTCAVIAVVAVAVIKTQTIVQKADLVAQSWTAQYKTKAADVITVPIPQNGLRLWLDASSDKAFDSKPQNGQTVEIWKDLSENGNNATQTQYSSQRPLYIQNGLNSLPTLEFDGVDDNLLFDGSYMAQNSYSFFMVMKGTRPTNQYNFAVGKTGCSTGQCLVMGFWTGGSALHSHWHNNTYISLGSLYSTKLIHSVTFDKSSGFRIFKINGGNLGTKSGSTYAISSFSSAKLGSVNSFRFKGQISEVIAYDRALTTQETQEVESYLAEKYNIVIN